MAYDAWKCTSREDEDRDADVNPPDEREYDERFDRDELDENERND